MGHAEQLLFSRLYAQKSLFIDENVNAFFWTTASPFPVTLEFIELVPSKKVRVAGQLKRPLLFLQWAKLSNFLRAIVTRL